ncbi:MAG: tRNA 5-methoxyuridine(34)/uridine 5-oxyacetic acid(34) synthase CmoB, partial [Chloroflexota bacterium]|nr:tRNA 5-methoxyuridine(34)/uridine 5-oxyacetic acid(34) synthase CmoB [Chloroflexota bacterium]
MTTLDRLLQWMRVREALPHIPDDSRVLDVGCADGQLLRAAGDRLREGIGIDPDAPRAAGDGERRAPNVPTRFPILRG